MPTQLTKEHYEKYGPCPKREIGPYTLLQTCGACPEQYEVFRDEKNVGYLRLRHGSFYALAYLENGEGERVYDTCACRGDGIFEDYERDGYLLLAVAAIDNRLYPNEPSLPQSDYGKVAWDAYWQSVASQWSMTMKHEAETVKWEHTSDKTKQAWRAAAQAVINATKGN